MSKIRDSGGDGNAYSNEARGWTGRLLFFEVIYREFQIQIHVLDVPSGNALCLRTLRYRPLSAGSAQFGGLFYGDALGIPAESYHEHAGAFRRAIVYRPA